MPNIPQPLPSFPLLAAKYINRGSVIGGDHLPPIQLLIDYNLIGTPKDNSNKIYIVQDIENYNTNLAEKNPIWIQPLSKLTLGHVLKYIYPTISDNKIVQLKNLIINGEYPLPNISPNSIISQNGIIKEDNQFSVLYYINTIPFGDTTNYPQLPIPEKLTSNPNFLLAVQDYLFFNLNKPTQARTYSFVGKYAKEMKKEWNILQPFPLAGKIIYIPCNTFLSKDFVGKYLQQILLLDQIQSQNIQPSIKSAAAGVIDIIDLVYDFIDSKPKVDIKSIILGIFLDFNDQAEKDLFTIYDLDAICQTITNLLLKYGYTRGKVSEWKVKSGIIVSNQEFNE